MKLYQPLLEAKFVERLSRFAAVMEIDKEQMLVHIANSGRLGELLTSDNTMYLPAADPTSNRKTAYDSTLVALATFWCPPMPERLTPCLPNLCSRGVSKNSTAMSL